MQRKRNEKLQLAVTTNADHEKQRSVSLELGNGQDEQHKSSKSKRRHLAAASLAVIALGVGLAVALLVSFNSKQTRLTAGTAPLYNYGGPLTTTLGYDSNKIRLGPPPPGYRPAVSADAVYSAYSSSESHFGAIAISAGLGPPTIYLGTFSDDVYGTIQPDLKSVQPFFENTPVWIVKYTNVRLPLSAIHGGPFLPGANTSTTISGWTSNTGDVVTLISPETGHVLDEFTAPSGG